MLELDALSGRRQRPERDDPELDVLSRRGLEHESEYRSLLAGKHGDVVEIEFPDGDWSVESLERAQAETVVAMEEGAPVIFQGAFFDGRWMGFADFLIKVERPSRLGGWSYEPVDTKLARRVKPAALLQLCVYAEQLERLQEFAPEQIHVALGDMRQVSFPARDVSAYFRRVRSRFDAHLSELPETYPEPVAHCAICRWQEVCDGRRRDDDHLSLVAGIRRDQIRKLAELDITTAAELAGSDGRVSGIGDATLDKLRHQARLQLEERRTSERSYELLEPISDQGLCMLPPPSPGDLFFDMEGDPFVGDEGLEYLFGLVEVQPDGSHEFHEFWAHDAAEEKRAFEQTVDLITARYAEHPDMHVYHYAAYEETALKRLMGRHGTREFEVDTILRRGLLVDLYRAVRHGLRVSAESYSIKKLEPLYMDAREDEITDAAASIVAYEEYLETGDTRILEQISRYNEADCVSTWKLRDWLEGRREEAADRYGELPRPSPPEDRASEELLEAEAEVAELAAALLEGVPDDPDDREPDQHGRWLLAHLLSYHRREAKSEWWEFFHRLELTDDELFEDGDCLARLEFTGQTRPEKKSTVYRYRFDPTQEYSIGVGDTVHRPGDGDRVGTVFGLDDSGWIEIKTTVDLDDEGHPTALVPCDIIRDTPLRDALQRVAHHVIEHGITDPGSFLATRGLLRGQPPKIAGHATGQPLQRDGETPLEALERLALGMDRTVLPIQGPPGAGKTYSAARAIIALVAAGKRVGVTALSHKAISNLLSGIADAATEAGRAVRIVQKADGEQACDHDMVTAVRSNDAVIAALDDGEADVVAGTAWLFATPDMDSRLDAVFVDEASQMPLANAIVVGCATDNLVLVGDPQQLPQPSKGSHPPGVAASALDHLLGERPTFPSELGLFLDTTYRLHPDINSFTSEVVYEGRLRADESCARRHIGGDGDLGGTGLRYVPVEHHRNSIASPEECEVVAGMVEDLLGRSWTDGAGRTRPLELDDIVIVAPYNAQVSELRAALPAGARVGTVDKFQGQQAPVAIYSTATSSLEDMPRSMEFLYSVNRLNVAASRAQALAIIVSSPLLLDVSCRTPEQVRLVNALCRFVEMADILSTD